MKNLEFMYFELPLQSQAIHYGSLAQLVQSICLTSRGSGVRIPQRPRSLRNSEGFFYTPAPAHWAGLTPFWGQRTEAVGDTLIHMTRSTVK